MNGKTISMAMSDIDEDLLLDAQWEQKTEAEKAKERKRRVRYRIAAWSMAAACVILFLGLGIYRQNRLPGIYLQGQEITGEGIAVNSLVSPVMLAEYSQRSTQLALYFDVKCSGTAKACVSYGELETYEGEEIREAGQECSLNGDIGLVWYLSPEMGERYELVISRGDKRLTVFLEYDEAGQEWKIYSEK